MDILIERRNFHNTRILAHLLDQSFNLHTVCDRPTPLGFEGFAEPRKNVGRIDRIGQYVAQRGYLFVCGPGGLGDE